MKNAIKVYINDLKNIVNNKATLIIIIGLIILPSLYAWFNIAALIDPYSNASNLPIAVLSKDGGTKLEGEKLNVGDEVVANLHQNDELAWQFPESEDEMLDKLNKGDYYAAIIIPKNFSKDLAEAVDTYRSPSVKYIVNEKVNAIAPKMTEAGAEGITAEINSEVNSVVTKYIVDYSNQLNDKIKGQEADYDQGLNSLNQIISKFVTIDSAFSQYQQITDNVDSGIELINDFNQQINTKVNAIDYSHIYQTIDKLENEDIDQSVVSDLKNQVDKVSEFTLQFNLDIDTSDYNQVSRTISDFIYNQWPTYKSQLVSGRDKLVTLGDDYNQIAEYLTKDGDKASEFMANPVNLKTEKLYPVDNYGSASMPFYTTLCLWVGSLLLVSLLSTKTKMQVSVSSEYFGKLLLFLTIGLLQAVIVTIGNVSILAITVVEPKMLLVFNLFISIVFITIVYTLVYVFGNIGKALGIIILVLSISGGGGNFPIEVSGPFFNEIYPYLPFTYGVRLLREAGAGIYMPTVYECASKLALMLGVSICFGMIGTRFLKPIFDRFDQKSMESHILH